MHGRSRCAASDRRRIRRDSGWRRHVASRRSPTAPKPGRRYAFLSKPLAANGSASTSKTGSRGSSDATGSWNTTCRSPRSARRARRIQRRDVGTEHLDGTRLRRGQVQDLVQRRRLARPRLADDAQRAALLEFEADAVDRPHLTDGAAKHHTLGQFVCLDQVADPQHDRRVGCRLVRGGRRGGDTVDVRGTAARRRARFGCMRRDGSGRPATNSGSAVRQSSMASGQRGANGHPGGSAASDGGAPGIGTSRAPCGASSRGTEPRRPGGVRHPAVAVELADRGHLDGTPGVHHQRTVGEFGDHPEVVGDDQHARAGDVACGLQNVEDLRLHGDVQRGGRLVADE